MSSTPTNLAAEAVARRSYGKLVAFLSVRTRDVAAAEDALSEAFAAALVDWPRNGCPANPEAWLLTVARRKAIDEARRSARIVEPLPATESEDIPDRRLALMFACAHPAIDEGIRAPLIMQAVLGMDAAKISSAFLLAPATMGKRLVRAKEKIREAGIPLRIPEPDELRLRLEPVLDAIYTAFMHDPDEALFLGRLVMELLPAQAAARGLLALMLYVDSRRRARLTPEYVPLSEQNLNLWDGPMIQEAESLLKGIGSVGRYQLEAAIQSAHVHRLRTGESNWSAIVRLYDVLFRISESPVVLVNRAVAIAELAGAAEGLAAMPEDAKLLEYQPYWAARADLLRRTGDHDQARQAYDMAIGLERDPAVRAFLMRQAASSSADGSTATGPDTRG